MNELGRSLDDLRQTKPFQDSWRSDEDILRILEHKYGLNISNTCLNTFFTKNYANVDCEIGFDGMFRHRHSIRNEAGKQERHQFYFFAGLKTKRKSPPLPSCPSDVRFWQRVFDENQVYCRSDHPRRRSRPQNADDDTSAESDKRLRMSLSPPELPSLPHDTDPLIVVSPPLPEDTDPLPLSSSPPPPNADQPIPQTSIVPASDTPTSLIVESSAELSSIVGSHDVTWISKKTHQLFGVADGEDVKLCLLRRIEKIEQAMKSGSVSSIVDKEDNDNDELSESDIVHAMHKCQYLRLAYLVAKHRLKYGNGPDGFTWDQCCEEVIQTMEKVNAMQYHPRTIQRWNIEFRQNELFASPNGKTDYVPHVFSRYPNAKKLASRYLDANLRVLSTDFAASYFRSRFIDDLLREEEKDMNNEDEDEVNTNTSCSFDEMSQENKQMMRDTMKKNIGISSMPLATARQWLTYLGFRYDSRKNVFLSDEHEAEANKQRRREYINEHDKDEIIKYRWVQLTETQAKTLIQATHNSTHPLTDDTPYHAYEHNNIQMREYHIQENVALLQCVELTGHGGNLSVRKPANRRAMLDFGQDESIFEQNIASSRTWYGSQGQSVPMPKGAGQTLMISMYVGYSLGCGLMAEVSDNAFHAINEKRSNATYLDKESALETLGRTTKKLFVSKKEIQNTLCVMFEYGKEKEGYWNFARTATQFEDAVDIVTCLWPDHDHEFHFDQSSGHKKKRKDGLNEKVMNKLFGGKQPPMGDTLLNEGDMGQHNVPGRLSV